MSQQELLKLVVQTLDNTGVEYMLTGSVVSSLHGEPRSTHDIDIVVAIKRPSAKALVDAFPTPRYHLTTESILDAISHHGMFNLLDTNTGDKVDFWMLTDEPFDRSRFMRRRIEEVLGIKLAVSSPEDTILAKLNWAKRSGGSEKQFNDALHVYEVQSDNLNMEYLRRWAKDLDVEPLLKQLKDEAEPV
ncbi:MAG: hypothetical protein U9N44_07840 [Chloroflexota bacterium]|nr:hypothetical protein [Chloroflexota bacterium]